MIISQETTCENCDTEFSIEFNIEDHPQGLKVCPFCEELLPVNQDVAELDFGE